MSIVIALDDAVEIPADMDTFEDFRRWTWSDDFPERGRIDFVGGRIEVDMSPERVDCHSLPKTEIGTTLGQLVRNLKLGVVVIDRTRIASVPAELSAEPDIAFISFDSYRSERVINVPSRKDPQGIIELHGAVDLIVEVISDRSVRKDTKRLPKAYFDAGVREFWLVDARGDELRFTIFERGRRAFRATPKDVQGFQSSKALPRRFRLTRTPDEFTRWSYRLEHKPLRERRRPAGSP